MERNLNTTENSSIARSDEQRSSSVWLEDHAKLIEKLESAYEAPKETSENINLLRFYGLTICGINLIIDENTSSELLEENNVFHIPLSPNWLVGVSNVRGDVIPIVDFEKILSKQTREIDASQHKTIIIGDGENALGLISDQFPKLISFKKESQTEDYSQLPNILHDYIKFAFAETNDIWVSIDLPEFFKFHNQSK